MPDALTDVVDWLRIGRVAGPLGVRGELKVELDTDFPDRFANLRTVHVGTEHRPMAVAGARQYKGRVALRLEAITDRTAAESLRGAALSVPQSEAVPLPPGHYYHYQIVGLRAVTTGGEALGTVREVLTTGSNDVYVVSDGAREVLIPALRDVVRSIDLEQGVLVVEGIDALL